MNKEPCKNGIEFDAIYARRIYCYLANRPHLVKWAKRQINKRARRRAKQELRVSL